MNSLIPPSWDWACVNTQLDEESESLQGSIAAAYALQLCQKPSVTKSELENAWHALYNCLLYHAEKLHAADVLVTTFLSLGAVLCKLTPGNHEITQTECFEWAVAEAGALRPNTPGLTPQLWLLLCTENLASRWRLLHSTHQPGYVRLLWTCAACILLGCKHQPHREDLLPIIVRLIDLSRDTALMQTGMEPRMGEARAPFAHSELPAHVLNYVECAMRCEPENQDVSAVLSDWLISPGDQLLACMNAQTQVDRDTVLLTYGSWQGQLRGFPDLRGSAEVEDVVDLARFGTHTRAATGLKFLLECYVPRYKLWNSLDTLQQQACPVIVQVAGGWSVILKHPHTASMSCCMCPTARDACTEWLACVLAYGGGIANSIRVV